MIEGYLIPKELVRLRKEVKAELDRIDEHEEWRHERMEKECDDWDVERWAKFDRIAAYLRGQREMLDKVNKMMTEEIQKHNP